MASPVRLPGPPALPPMLMLLVGALLLAARGGGDAAAEQALPGATAPSPPPPGQVCGEGCCVRPAPEGSAVAAFCRNRTGATLRGRCCLERETVLGLDLGNCSLTTLCSSFHEASTAVIIDLTSNPLLHLPGEAFRGFTQLQTLALPQHLDCPGGNEGWESVSIRGSSRSCQGPRNPCNGSAGLVWLCPEASRCTPDGPGLSQCLCMSPFHGYKCLRQGSFPYLLFFGTLGAITAALSIVLWATQRRKAKTS
ncbi:hypothetical protein JRQ81_005507 [Phrynocephalus forsythii]|uniref:EGF-like domain-containing protein n=1 Tax=Phrynocephalus forsythii TaxID=171643 RepID=A0A9Q1B6T4_9SAUR|nr:hypothetical protein JRQ81_005507 [Phrynocephalus forsythii]